MSRATTRSWTQSCSRRTTAGAQRLAGHVRWPTSWGFGQSSGLYGGEFGLHCALVPSDVLAGPARARRAVIMSSNGVPIQEISDASAASRPAITPSATLQLEVHPPRPAQAAPVDRSPPEPSRGPPAGRLFTPPEFAGLTSSESSRRDRHEIRDRLYFVTLDLQPVHSRILRSELDIRGTVAGRQVESFQRRGWSNWPANPGQ